MESEYFIGKHIREYKIIGIIGQGGMATVFKAEHERLKTLRAIKVIRESWSGNQKFINRFEREARLLVHLSHPNLVQIHDFFEEQGHLFLVMEFLSGKPLSRIVKRRHILLPEEILPIAIESLNGLAAAHESGIVHRDISPDNIILVPTRHGEIRPVIIDFGIAKALTQQDFSGTLLSQLTTTGSFTGKVAYCSPEQVGNENVDGRSDLYSLGLVIHRVLTGVIAFNADTPIEMMALRRMKAPPSLSESRPDLNFPKKLEDVLQKALARNPDDRFQSARKFKSKLEETLLECASEEQISRAEKMWNMELREKSPQSVKSSVQSRSSGHRIESRIRDRHLPEKSTNSLQNTAQPENDFTEDLPHAQKHSAVIEESKKPLRNRSWARRAFVLLVGIVMFATLSITLGRLLSENNKLFDREQNTALNSSLKMFPVDENTRAGAVKSIAMGDGISLDIVYIPTGMFQMGQSESEKQWLIKSYGTDFYNKWFSDENPRHPARITGFWMGKFEVTVGQFRQFTAKTGYVTTAEENGTGWGYNPISGNWGEQKGMNWRNPGFKQTDLCPVTIVSLTDALEFCQWISKLSGYRFTLPTEAQWEYACRAGTETVYFWGNNPKQGKLYLNKAESRASSRKNFDFKDGYWYTAPVGEFKPNQWGLFDMHGNVWEWCRDGWHADYRNAPPDGSCWENEDSASHVIRGGGWSDQIENCRSAFRIESKMDARDHTLGFRIVSSGI